MLELKVYSAKAEQATGLVCLPSDNVLKTVKLRKTDNGFVLDNDPYVGKVKWTTEIVK